MSKVVESSQELLWFNLTLRCDWSTKIAPSSQPIRGKTKDKRDLVIPVGFGFSTLTRLLFFSFQVVSLFSLDAVLGKPRFFRSSKTRVFSFVHCNYTDVQNVFL